MLKRGGTVLIGLIVASLAVAACVRSSPEVVVYTSEDQVFSEPVLKDFEKASGIRVRAVYDTEETKSTGVALRIVAERGRPQADVFWANEPLRTVMLQQQGLLEAYRSPSADDIPARYRDPGGHWTGFSARARVILYNTNEVKAGEVPSSVRDLVDPRWKGRAGLANPLFGTTTTQVAALVALWGEPATKKFLDEIKVNGVKLVTSNGEAKDLVASGELAWAFTDTDDASEAVEQHKPVAVVYPDQTGIGTLVMPNAVAMVKGAPHPEPAKKLIDYLLSRQVEEQLAKSTAAQMPLRVLPRTMCAAALPGRLHEEHVATALGVLSTVGDLATQGDVSVVIRPEDVSIDNGGPFGGRVESATCLGGAFETAIIGPGWRLWALTRDQPRPGSLVRFAVKKPALVRPSTSMASDRQLLEA